MFLTVLGQLPPDSCHPDNCYLDDCPPDNCTRTIAPSIFAPRKITPPPQKIAPFTLKFSPKIIAPTQQIPLKKYYE